MRGDSGETMSTTTFDHTGFFHGSFDAFDISVDATIEGMGWICSFGPQALPFRVVCRHYSLLIRV